MVPPDAVLLETLALAVSIAGTIDVDLGVARLLTPAYAYIDPGKLACGNEHGLVLL